MAEDTTTITGAATSTSAEDGNKTEEAKPGAVTQAATTEGAKGEAQPGAEAKADSDKGKTFTQDEVEELVKQRLEQQRQAAQRQADDKSRQERERLLAEQGNFKDLLTTREQDLEQARAELKAERLTNAVLQEAASHNVTNTRALMKLIKDEVEYDEGGKPTNLKALVAQALKDVPGLVETQAQQGTTKVELPANNPARNGAEVPDGPVSLFTPGLFKS